MAIEPGRGLRSVATQALDDVATQKAENMITRFISSTSVRRITEIVGQPRSTVHKVLCYHQFELSLVQKLLKADFSSQQSF